MLLYRLRAVSRSHRSGRLSSHKFDDDANRNVYGKDVTGEQILLGKGVRTNATVDSFMKTLQKVSPAHVDSTTETNKKS